MLNPQSVAHHSVEIIDGSISEFYEMVDSALRPSEVCPAKYNTTTSPSYQNQCPCVQGSFTTVDIGCADPNVVLMEKSFIAFLNSSNLVGVIILIFGFGEQS